MAALDFNVTTPSAYRFLERFSKIANVDVKLFNFARYLIELPLIEYRMLKYSPSNLAASALFLAQKIMHREEPAWNETMTQHSGYNESQLKPCAKDLCVLLQGIEKCSLQAVRKKYSLPKYNEVALISIEN